MSHNIFKELLEFSGLLNAKEVPEQILMKRLRQEEVRAMEKEGFIKLSGKNFAITTKGLTLCGKEAVI